MCLFHTRPVQKEHQEHNHITCLIHARPVQKEHQEHYLELDVSVTQTIPETDELRRSHVHDEGVRLLNGSVEGSVGDPDLGLDLVAVVQVEVVTLVGGGQAHVFPRLDRLEAGTHISGRKNGKDGCFC